MTRETKIGLLVGLAFIIVIGILLSEQIMQATEPLPAPRDEVAETVRKGTTTPASHNRVAPPAVAAQDPSPDNAVPTREEIAHHAPPVTWVNVGPGGQNSAGPIVVVGGNEPNHAAPPSNTAGQNPTPGPTSGMVRREIADASHPNTPRSLVDEAAAAGETLIGPDGQPLRARTPLPPATPNHPVPPSTENRSAIAGMKQYKAEPGDSLSKLALKQMGANTKANRDAIVKANPSLAADPNKIIIGVTYNIPAASAAPAVAGGNVPAPAAPVTPRPAPERAAPVAVDNIYVVQPGDSLTRIAKDHMGDLSTMAAIKELNKETVKNWDVLQVGTKLRMPGKPLASAQ
jgi:LysM repeat protein